jgi:hypothetical protein
MILLAPTRTAHVALLDDGCVVTRVLPGIKQTPADATENLQRTVQACGGQRRPLLLDLSCARPLEAEVRHYYTGRILVESFVALAVLVDGSPFGRMMGNVYLRIARPGIPTRLFADEAGARDWLRRFVS